MGDRLRAGIPSRYVTSQLTQLSLASLRSRLIEHQLRLGSRGNVPSDTVGPASPQWKGQFGGHTWVADVPAVGIVNLIR